MARTYYCKCGGRVESDKGLTCGQTQVEFSQQSMKESVEGMGGEW